MLKKLINKIAGIAGYTIVNKKTADKMYVSFDIDPEFEKIYDKTEPYTMTTIDRMFELYKAVQYVAKNNIPGDIVEAGVYKGGSMMLAAYTLQESGDTSRKLYLYDTYTGMAQPTEEDVRYGTEEEVFEKWKQKSKQDHNEWNYATLDEVKSNMNSTGYPRENTIYVKGKVEDTMPQTVPENISVLRLDTDFYESTKHGLIHLFPRLVRGGVLIIDDYGSWRGARKAVDEYIKENDTPILLVNCDHACVVGVKV